VVHPLGGEYTKPLEMTFEVITEFELVRRFAKPLYSLRGVAQLAEHSTPNRAVGGSSPLAPAKNI
jgi:hypothetical protein